MKEVELTADLSVGQSKVVVTVSVGDGQIGGSAIFLDGKLIAKGQIANHNLGNGKDLAGKQLQVKTVVTDVRDETNRTVVYYTFKIGGDVTAFSTAGVVDNDGDSMLHRGVFDLS